MRTFLAFLFTSVLVALPALAQRQPVPGGIQPQLKDAPLPAQLAGSPYEKPARDFVEAFNAGRLADAGANFNEAMKKAVTPAALKGLKQQADEQVGAFRSFKDTRHTVDRGLVTIEFIAAYEKADVDIGVVFDREGRIGSVYFNPLVEEKVDPSLERIARDILDAINAGSFQAAAARFDQRMKGELPPAKLAAVAAQMRQAYGPFRSVTSVHQTTQPSGRSVDLLAAYAKMPVKFTVVFDPKQEIVTGVFVGAANVDPTAR